MIRNQGPSGEANYHHDRSRLTGNASNKEWGGRGANSNGDLCMRPLERILMTTRKKYSINISTQVFILKKYPIFVYQTLYLTF